MTKRGLSWIFLLAAVCLAIASTWFARHQLSVLFQWKSADGTLISREVLRNHDSDGVLYFQMKAAFRYLADGKEITSTAESYFGSRDFGSFAEQVLEYKAGMQYPLRYNPAKPEVFEFSAGFHSDYLQIPLQYLEGAILCLLFGLLLCRLSRPKGRCAQCNRTVQSFYRYCPECGESISLA